MRRRGSVFAGLLLALLLAAGPASAQTDASVERFDEGVEMLRQSRFEEAAAAFRESYRLAPRVTTMCNLALTYDRWGEHQERAVRAYRTCARDDDTGRFGTFAERRVQELEREIALSDMEEPAAPPPAPEPEPPPPRTDDHVLLWVGVGTGALAAGAFVAGLVLALDASQTVDELRAQLGASPTVVRGSEEHRRLEGAQDAATAATALYVGAGIAGAAAASFIVVDLVTADSPTSERVQVRTAGAGLQLDGRF